MKYLKIIGSVTKNELYISKTKITDKYLEKDLVKFIPASGAATRMFEHLYKYIETEEETELVKEFFDNIEKFAFYEEIKDSVKDKNIDNVTHQDRVKDTIDNKKKLASIGSTIKEQIDNYIKTLLNDSFNLKEIERFLKETLHINYKKELTKEIALAFLNRPLRVCGVVLNTGEPGGGPFIVDNGEYTDLQICEKSEVNFNDNLIVKAFNSSKYFNPVDLVCFVKDYENDKFNLLNYINEDRYFISKKSHEGTPIKALEHPGLWNGAMHNWNTVFVEVPLTTFNPVKTVNDLLREGHQSKK